MNRQLSFTGDINTPMPLSGQAENRAKDNSATNGTSDTRPGSGKSAPTDDPRGAATVPGGSASAVPATGPGAAFSGISDGSPMPRPQGGGEAGNFQRSRRMCDRPGYAEFYRETLAPWYNTHIRTEPLPQRVEIYPGKGALSVSQGGNKFKVPGSGGGRSGIEGFSHASRKRFREAILSRRPAVESWEIGVTFTIPGVPPSVEETKSMFHRLQLAISRAGMGMFWRVELQKREAAHWHCLIIASKNEYSQGDILPFFQKMWADILKTCPCRHKISQKVGKKRISRVNWEMHDGEISPEDMEIEPDEETRSVYAVIPRSMCRGAFVADYSRNARACVVEAISENGSGWTRYLCDHATKTKQGQEAKGYGRHWGVVGREKFVENRAALSVNLSDKAFSVWLRAVGKMSRPRIAAKCVFGFKQGYRSRRGRVGRSVWFGNDETYKRLAEWAAGQG